MTEIFRNKPCFGDILNNAVILILMKFIRSAKILLCNLGHSKATWARGWVGIQKMLIIVHVQGEKRPRGGRT